MKYSTSAFLLTAAAALAFAASAHAATIALNNGSLESPSYYNPNDQYPGWVGVSPGAVSFSGWSMSGPVGASPVAYEGSQGLWSCWSVGWCGLSQHSSYTVGAADEEITAGIYAKAGDVGSGQATVRVDVLLNGSTANFTQVGITTSNGPWTLYTATYTTTASDIGKTVGISFGTDGGYNTGGTPSYTYMDNASLSVIPEPGAALLGGLGMLALLRRRR